MYTRNYLFNLLAIIVLLTSSCKKAEEDVAPNVTYNGKANMTIAELLSYYTVSTTNLYNEIPDGTIISGIVTSCDKEKNCYQYLTIQDETGAIMVRADNTALYAKYPVGLRIYVECGTMVIGHKYRNKQIGFWKDDAISGIPTSDEDKYIFRNAEVGQSPSPLVITSKNQIDETMFNKFVCIEGCRMQNGGTDTYCDNGASTSRYMMLSDSTKMVLRTNSRATFADELLPSGKCDLTGILINSNSGPQLFIRSLDDVKTY